MKIHGSQIKKKSSTKALKIAKNEFHVMKAIYLETCTFKTPHFVIRNILYLLIKGDPCIDGSKNRFFLLHKSI